MSTVTNIVLQTSGLDGHNVNSINGYLRKVCNNTLEQVHEDVGGGNKNMEVVLHIGAYNGFIGYQDDLITLFKTLEWDYAEETVLIITPQEGSAEVYTP